MFIKRDLSKVIRLGVKQSPIVAIIGPRQSGKSTLIKKMFPDYVYLDMQDAELFDFANKDPKGFLNSYKNNTGVIIDEAQYAPNLFPQLKVEVDKDQKVGYYILSGSQNFLLHEKISESLAGRVYFYNLLPFSIKELKKSNLLSDSIEGQIVKGFYPKIYQPNINPRTYYENYLLTYVERDIRSIKNIDNILIFKKFMQLCALRIGTPLNYTDLASNCGISVNTAKSWLALLETSFVLFLLPPYHNNLGKRITKSPKLYFYDVGLAAMLMGLDLDAVLKKREICGALFENMVIVDIKKNLNVHGDHYISTFFRENDKNEIDFVLERGGKVTPIEIKSSQTMKDNFFDTIFWFNEKIKNEQRGIVVYGGDSNQKRTKGRVISWKNLESIVD